MIALWIRMEADEVRSVRIASLANALSVTQVHALGYFAAFNGAIARQCPDGNLQAVPDRLLEQWAEWDGEPGQFAQAARVVLLDSDCQVKGWAKAMGKLVQDRAKDRERKKPLRGVSAEIPSTRDVTDVTKQNGRNDDGPPARARGRSAPRARPTTPGEQQLANVLGFPNPTDNSGERPLTSLQQQDADRFLRRLLGEAEA